MASCVSMAFMVYSLWTFINLDIGFGSFISLAGFRDPRTGKRELAEFVVKDAISDISP
jgi:hypothetical protein